MPGVIYKQRACGVVVSHALSKRKAPSSILGRSIIFYLFFKLIITLSEIKIILNIYIYLLYIIKCSKQNQFKKANIFCMRFLYKFISYKLFPTQAHSFPIYFMSI